MTQQSCRTQGTILQGERGQKKKKNAKLFSETFDNKTLVSTEKKIQQKQYSSVNCLFFFII